MFRQVVAPGLNVIDDKGGDLIFSGRRKLSQRVVAYIGNLRAIASNWHDAGQFYRPDGSCTRNITRIAAKWISQDHPATRSHTLPVI